MNNAEIKQIVDLAISDKDYVIDQVLPTLRLVRKSLSTTNLTSKQFGNTILKIDQAIATAKFMRSHNG